MVLVFASMHLYNKQTLDFLFSRANCIVCLSVGLHHEVEMADPNIVFQQTS